MVLILSGRMLSVFSKTVLTKEISTMMSSWFMDVLVNELCLHVVIHKDQPENSYTMLKITHASKLFWNLTTIIIITIQKST